MGRVPTLHRRVLRGEPIDREVIIVLMITAIASAIIGTGLGIVL